MMQNDWVFWLYIAMLCICIPVIILSLLLDRAEGKITTLNKRLKTQQADQARMQKDIRELREDLDEWRGYPRTLLEADIEEQEVID